MSAHDIPLDKAELLGTILGGILYGFSLLMFAGTIWVLFARRSIPQVNRVMLTVACLLLLCSTALISRDGQHIIIDIIRIMEALILYRDTYPGGPIAFLSDVSQWTFVSKNYVYAVQSLIGDGVILYRCCMVWKSKRIMILPGLVWCASAVAGVGATVQAPKVTSFGGSFVRWIMAFYATAFTNNLMTTVLLAYRIWYVDRRTMGLRGRQRSKLRKILHIIIDAGVIYNLTLLAVWICFSLELNGQFVALDIIVPIISITFYMVIIRVGLATGGNWPPRAPLRHGPTGDDHCVDRTQVHIAPFRLTDDELGDDSQLSSMGAADGGSRPTRNEIKVGDITEEIA